MKTKILTLGLAFGLCCASTYAGKLDFITNNPQSISKKEIQRQDGSIYYGVRSHVNWKKTDRKDSDLSWTGFSVGLDKNRSFYITTSKLNKDGQLALWSVDNMPQNMMLSPDFKGVAEKKGIPENSYLMNQIKITKNSIEEQIKTSVEDHDSLVKIGPVADQTFQLHVLTKRLNDVNLVVVKEKLQQMVPVEKTPIKMSPKEYQDLDVRELLGEKHYDYKEGMKGELYLGVGKVRTFNNYDENGIQWTMVKKKSLKIKEDGSVYANYAPWTEKNPIIENYLKIRHKNMKMQKIFDNDYGKKPKKFNYKLIDKFLFQYDSVQNSVKVVIKNGFVE